MIAQIKLSHPAITSLVLLIFTLVHINARAQPIKKNLNIVFIGNSITEGTGLPDRITQAPPIRAGEKLRTLKNIGTVQVKNVGKSGSTTIDWLPSKNLFLNAEKAANQFTGDSTSAQLVFSLVLGTNDSAMKGPHGAPVSPDDYHSNLMAIADRLLNEYPDCMLIFQYPTWYSENTYNTSMYLKEGLQRLQSYFPQIDDVVKRYHHTHPGRVFAGNKKVFKYFKRHTELFRQENGQQGIFNLHPNIQGSIDLGNFWAEAIYKVMH